MNLSDKIVELRKKNGFSQEDLADELQVSRQAVSRWEQGTADPSSSNILELSKLFNVTTDYLLNDDYYGDEDLPKIKEIRKDNLQQILLYFVLLEIICFLLQVASIIVLQNDFYGMLCIILFIAIIIIFIALCIITPIVKNGLQLLTYNNILNILQQASPRMFLALGVAGLILLAGTDLSVGRMVGMGMTAATIIMHQGINTGSVFGHIFDFTGLPVIVRVLLALVVCITLCTFFTTIAGFFTAKFKMHPFISTMANMLVIFGLKKI